MNTKQTLVENYLNLGTQKGFDNVSLQELADSVGIKKASIFSHFQDYDSLKKQAISFCTSVLETKSFEINPKAPNAETLFLALINSFIDVFADFPINALLALLEQKQTYDSDIRNLSDRIDLMLSSRFQVALDFCIQRSWTEANNTDDLALLFASYLRKLLVSQKVSDESLSDFIDMILSAI